MAFSHQLQTIINLVGHQSAIRIVRSYGGRSYQVPEERVLHDMHPLVVSIGMASAQALAREFGGLRILLPSEVNALLQLRNESILQRYRAGESISAISQDLEINRKLVQRILDEFQARGKIGKAERDAQQSLLLDFGSGGRSC